MSNIKQIPTAKEFRISQCVTILQDLSNKDWEELMIEFAKLHVEAALKEASEKATVTPIDHEEISEGSFRPIWGVDDDSILNAYNLDRIK